MEVTESVGSMMSSIEKWLTEERSYGITGAGILLSLLIIIFAGFIFLKSSINVLHFEGHKYEITGIAKTVDNGREIFMPVYREIK